MNFTRVKDIFSFIDSIAPFNTQCEWDNAGLLVGNPEKPVKKALVCLDATQKALSLAAKQNCELIITHHPVIFSPLKTVPFGSAADILCKADISVISAHTNFDAAEGGVNDVLANILDLQNICSFGEGEADSTQMARIGELKNEMTDSFFAAYVAKKLDCGVKFVPFGRTLNSVPDKKITKVAVCGGAGADFMQRAIALGADAFVTADTKHHEQLFAAENNLCLVDAGHYRTENPAVFALTKKLQDEFKNIEFISFEGEDPIEYITKEK